MLVDNAVNGVPMCANKKYLDDVLRKSWDFEGYVTSDCDAVGDVYGAHHFTTPANGTALSLKAGTDMDCGDWGAHAYLKELPAALAAGLVNQTDLDRALVRLTRLQMDLGLFDPKSEQQFFANGIDLVHSAEHQRHAMEAAQQSIVLLKNQDTLLPLKRGIKIAVIGPHAMGTEVFLSNCEYLGVFSLSCCVSKLNAHAARCIVDHGSACLNTTGGIAGSKTFDCLQTPLEAINASNIGGTTIGLQPCDNTICAHANISAAVATAHTKNRSRAEHAEQVLDNVLHQVFKRWTPLSSINIEVQSKALGCQWT